MTPEQKKKCHAIIHSHAVAAAAGNAVPIPGLGVAVEVSLNSTGDCMISKIELLKKVLTGELHEDSFWRPIRPATVPVTNVFKKFVLRNVLGALERRRYRTFLPVRPGVGHC